MLIGKGVPKRRYGIGNYFQVAASVATGSQSVRGLKMVKFASGASGVLELLSISDAGFLVKQNGASYSIIPGYSYVSGYDTKMAQTFNRVFITNGVDNLTKYDGASIIPYISISRPTSVTATNVSGVSGTFTYAWQITAENAVGETLPTTEITLGNLPRNVASTTVRLNWTTASPASGVLRYNIYGRDSGFETLLATVNASSTTFLDDGSAVPSLIALPPEGDSTAGPIMKYICVSKDKLFGANINTSPSRLVWTGGGSNIDRFHWSVGGGYVEISPDDGDEITGIVDSFDSILVFKNRSIWKVTLSVNSAGIVIPNVNLITRAIGCIAPKSVQQVENDVFFLSNKGVYVVGNEPNVLASVLRTNEVSAVVRPIFQSLNTAQIAKASAVYYDNKYRLSYPSSGLYNDKEIWYDRERLAWVGPMSYSANPSCYEVFVDGANATHLLWGDSNDNYVTEYGSSYSSDKGDPITTSFLSKKEYFKDPFLFKRINKIFTNWRNVNGSVNVNIVIETRSGTTVTAKSFSISPTGGGVGWGFDPWGKSKWGNTLGAGTASSATDLERWLKLSKTARNIQFEIITSTQSSTYELLAIKMTYRFQNESVIPTSERVS